MKEHGRENLPQVEEEPQIESSLAEQEKNRAEQLEEFGETIERSAAQSHDTALFKGAEISGYAEKRGTALTPEEDDENMTLLTRSKRSYDKLRKRVARAQRRLVGAIALTASMMAGEAPPRPEAEPQPDMPTVVEFGEDEVIEAQAVERVEMSEQEDVTEEATEAEPKSEQAAERPATEPEPETGADLEGLMEQAAESGRQYAEGPIDTTEYAALAAEGRLDTLSEGPVAVYAVDGQRDTYVMVEDGRDDAYVYRSRDPETAQEFARNFSQHDDLTRRILTAFRRQEQTLEDRGLLARPDGRHGETVPDSVREHSPELTMHTEVRAVYDDNGDVMGITEWTIIDEPAEGELDDEYRRRWSVPEDGVNSYRFIPPEDPRFDGYADILEIQRSENE